MLKYNRMNAFAAIADPTRSEIIQLLSKNGEMTATDICRQFKMSPPAISQHLKVLYQAQLVEQKRDAQRRLYTVNKHGINQIDQWVQDIKSHWNDQLESLDLYLKKIQNKD